MVRQLCISFFVLTLLSSQSARAADEQRDFENKVRPILVARCQSCHGAKKQESNLRLDTKAGFEKGGDNGAVIDSKQLDQSELLLAIRREGGRKMPPDKPLAAEELDVLTEWIRHVHSGRMIPPHRQPMRPLNIGRFNQLSCPLCLGCRTKNGR